MKPEDRKRLKQHVDMIVDHKMPGEEKPKTYEQLEEENKSLRHIMSTWRKTTAQEIIDELENKNRKLRLELHTLRFKESQEQRFIWWIWNVYAKNVQDLLTAINESVIDGADSIWSFVNNLRDYTEKIYDGTYLDVEMSVDVNEPSNSDISVTQNVLMDIKTSSDNNKLDNDSLEYAAKWIENSLVGETNERVIEFGKNMAMSIRAAMSSTGNEVCPDCGGSGELAGDYFSSDGMFSCGRCNGTGAIWANTIT